MDAPLDDFSYDDGGPTTESFGSLIVGYLVIATIVLLPYLAAYAIYQRTW